MSVRRACGKVMKLPYFWTNLEMTQVSFKIFRCRENNRG